MIARRSDRTAPSRAQEDARLSDADILEIIEPIYEHACWLAEMSVVDFDPFAELSRVIQELRLRAETAA
jgi:2-oxo-4-hydroxy-4-carboxy--5-ureidoimidazoline (OHCU) decarboxylase